MTSTQVKQGWQKVKLSEIAEIIMGQSPKSEYYTNNLDDLPFYQGCTEFQELYPIDRQYCSTPTKIAERNDILMSVRAPVGLLNISTKKCCIGRGLCAIRPKLSSYWFLYYLLKANVEYIQSFQKGSVYGAVNKNDVINLEFLIPNKDEVQQKIASILSAFDDLIENNTRRIKILENTAQLIYKEWFVDFKFPGHEKVKMVDRGTEFGEMPEGWEVKEIGEVIETLGGGTPSTKIEEYWECGDVNWFSPVDLTKNGMLFITNSGNKINQLGLQKSSAKMFPAYSVMMTSRATIGVVAINTTPACTNQGFITCIPNKILSAYQIYFWLEQNMSLINNLASGATFKEITKTNFRKIPITISDNEISEEFTRLVKPIFNEIENLQEQIFRLRETRDLLLPKLVGGEVEVDNLTIN